MDLVEVAPAEEVVKELLDYLVDPMLPLKASGEDPLLATQEAMAKQFMQRTDLTGTDDMECQLSVTEKAIRDACMISSALIALKDISNAERWKGSKVSALIIDSKKENCLLLFSSITNGAWSVIEKCIDISGLQLESPSEGKQTSKRKQMGRKALTGE